MNNQELLAWAQNNFANTAAASPIGTNIDRQAALASVIATCLQTIAIQQIVDLINELKTLAEKEQSFV
jgi:hypothetical protein